MLLVILRRPIMFYMILVFCCFIFNTVFAGTEEKEAIPQRGVYGGIYRRGFEHDPVTLDPAKLYDIYDVGVTQQIIEGLVQYSDNLMVIPCIAESWESSRDNLRWRFNLKKGIKFHNGREVIAEDFVYSFTRILDPKTDSVASSLLSRIKGASAFMAGKAERVEGLRALDHYTLEILLEEPFPPFISVLAMTNFGVVPKEEVERGGDDFGLHPVGTGPYRFKDWKRNEEIVLVANDAYHEGRPYLDTVIFKIFPGGKTEIMFDEFEKGDLEDSLLPRERIERVSNEGKYQVLRRPSLTIRLFIMNNSTPPLNSKKIRQALNYAIDKERITSEIGGGKLISASGLIPEGMAGYQPDDTNYPYSPEKARRLLGEAGFPEGEGLPVIQFWSSVTSKGPLAEDEAVKRNLAAVGIQAEFNYLTDWPGFKQMLKEGKAPVFKYSWGADVPDPDNILTPLFYSKSPQNVAFYHNPRVDTLIEKAQNESDYLKRISLYSQIQDLIMDDAPVILMSYLAYIRVFQLYVRNFEGKALGDHYFTLKRVWIEKEEAE